MGISEFLIFQMAVYQFGKRFLHNNKAVSIRLDLLAKKCKTKKNMLLHLGFLNNRPETFSL